jgi:hypothetical protein
MALVQGNIHQNGNTSSTTCIVTLGAPVASGGAVVLAFTGAGLLNTDLIGIQDNKGNNYTFVDAVYHAGAGYGGASYHLEGITGGPTIFTASIGASRSFLTLTAEEYSNIATISALDGHSATTDSDVVGTDSIAAGPFTTTASNDLVWGFGVSISGAGIVPGTGFTVGSINDVANSFTSEFKTLASPGSVSATLTPGSATDAIVFGIALKTQAAPTSSTGEADGHGTASGSSKTRAVATGTATGRATASGVGKTFARTTGQAAGQAIVVGTGEALTHIGTANGHATVTGVGKTIHYAVGRAAGHASVIGETQPPVPLGYWLSPSIPYPITPPGDEYTTSADGSLQPGAVMQAQLKAQKFAEMMTPTALGRGSRVLPVSSISSLGRSRGPSRTQFGQKL